MSLRIGGLLLIQTLYIVWFIENKPLRDSSQYSIELLNEMIFVACIYCLPLLTELIPDPDERYSMGYLLISLLIFMLISNMGFIIRLLGNTFNRKCFNHRRRIVMHVGESHVVFRIRKRCCFITN
jgi:hypothetical protein